MNELPVELRIEIFSYLAIEDLRNLRLTNRGIAFSVLTGSRLFDTLCMYGLNTIVPIANGMLSYLTYTSNTKTGRAVVFSELDKIVEELLPILPFVKTLIFAPTYYEREDFWSDYRADHDAYQYESYSALQEEVDFLSDDDLTNEDDGEECRAILRGSKSETTAVRDNRLTERKKHELRKLKYSLNIDEAEVEWKASFARQEANEQQSRLSLDRLFAAARSLCELKVQQWRFSRYGAVDLLFSDSARFDSECLNTVPEMLELVSQGLYTCRRRLQKLTVEDLCIRRFTIEVSLLSVFTNLRDLTLTLTSSEELLLVEGEDSSLYDLMAVVAHTLENLSLIFTSRIHHPEPGIHTLFHIFGDTSISSTAASTERNGAIDEYHESIVFPQLKILSLDGIIVKTESLSEFLKQQPCLERLHTTSIGLSTAGKTWHNTIIDSFPPSLHIWCAINLHERPDIDLDLPPSFAFYNSWSPAQLPSNWPWTRYTLPSKNSSNHRSYTFVKNQD